MKLAIFPLGNHGDKYERTRHNAARIVMQAVNVHYDTPNIEIITPDTFMNESGAYISRYMRYHESMIPVIVYDDKDLIYGDVRLSYGNSSGGHNGVQSVIDHIGLDFYRIRIGIGQPNLMPIHGAGVVQSYVMGNITNDEAYILKSKDLTDKVKSLLDEIKLKSTS